MPITIANEYALSLTECAQDTPSARACLHRNEDKIEDFSKWSQNMVRFVRSILEEAEKMSQLLPNLEVQMSRFSDFEEAFGVHKTVEALELISSLLRNTQSSNHKLVSNMADRMLTPLQSYFQEDFRELRESRRVFERATERYESAIARYYSLSKFKDVLELDGELAQLYDSRIEYFEQYFDHAAKVNDFKQVIDLLFLEKISFLIDELSEFFKSLSDNFLSVKTQMDQVRGEYDRLAKQSREQRESIIQDKQHQLEKIKAKWNTSAPITHQLSTRKSGLLYLKRKKALGNPWRRVYASITDGAFSYETIGRVRGSTEQGDSLNLMLCEIRPIEVNDRRFCFEIYSGTQPASLVLQAESEDELMDWVNTFHTAKTDLLDQRKSAAAAAASADTSAATALQLLDSATAESPQPQEKSAAAAQQPLPSIVKKWNEELQRHFDLSSADEVALCSFPASLHTDIWTQGRVFVSQYAVYFFTSLFGIGKKIVIPLRDVMKVDVVQSSFVTLINFTMSGDARDFTLKTFNTVDDSNDRFIDHLQRLHRNTQTAEPKNLKQLMQEMSASLAAFETAAAAETPESRAAVVQEAEKDEVDDEEGNSSSNNGSSSSNSSSPAVASTLASNALINEAAPLIQHSKQQQQLQQKPPQEITNVPTAEVPCGCSSHMDKRQVNIVLPIDCATAFDLMFGPDCPVQHAVQPKRKNRNYKITPWKVNQEGVQERTESYMFPLNNPLVRMKETECYVTMKLTKDEPGRRYIVDCRTNTPNIPYSDAFYTRTRYCITHAGPDQTRLSISLGITWLKSPFVKGIIRSATLKTFEDFCTDYLACLRAEISKRTGTTVAVGVGQATGQVQISDAAESATEPGLEQPAIAAARAPQSHASKLVSALLHRLLPGGNVHRLLLVQVAIVAVAIAIGYSLGSGGSRRSARRPGSLSSSAIHHYSTSSSSSLLPPSTWSSTRFQKSHSRLQSLHRDFSMIREGLLQGLERLDALELKVRRAEALAVLGDRLLKCIAMDQGKGKEACHVLEKEWQQTLQQ